MVYSVIVKNYAIVEMDGLTDKSDWFRPDDDLEMVLFNLFNSYLIRLNSSFDIVIVECRGSSAVSISDGQYVIQTPPIKAEPSL